MSDPAPEPLPAQPGQTAPEKAAEKERIDWIAEIRGLILMLGAVLAFHSLLAKPFYIPSISMMPGLLVGDRLVVSKFPYGWNWSSVSFHILPRGNWRVLGGTPQYGDLVIVLPRKWSSRRSSCQPTMTWPAITASTAMPISPPTARGCRRAGWSMNCPLSGKPCPMARVT